VRRNRLRDLGSAALARAVDAGVTLLRNRTALHLSREEFRFSRISFSAFGEDLAVLRWLGEMFPNAARVYVDAGAFHPIHCSNTLLLKKQGWWGVNIDMVPEKVDQFSRLRPDDFNVLAALNSMSVEMYTVECEGGLTDWLSCDPPAQDAQARRPTRSNAVVTTTLDAILAHAPRGIDRIGYLNIDCEGNDLEVLKGFSLSKYAPDIITIEALDAENVQRIVGYLSYRGYELKEKLHYTLLFIPHDVSSAVSTIGGVGVLYGVA
jgi:FkbM family methyltransferase